MLEIRVGPAGIEKNTEFRQLGRKNYEAPKWLRQKGLTAYEYQCNQGIRISVQDARILGKNAKLNDVKLSVHAPYYMNLVSSDEKKIERSIRLLLETIRVANEMEAAKVVFHPGWYGKIKKEKTLDLFISSLSEVRERVLQSGLEGVKICPETTGKLSQFGTFEEILKACKKVKGTVPAIDFAHIYTRLGAENLCARARLTMYLKGDSERRLNLKNYTWKKGAYKKILDQVKDGLKSSVQDGFHIHFSHIEFGRHGEIRHRTFADESFGPPFEPLVEALKECSTPATIICESKDSMVSDAEKMVLITR